MSKLLYNTQPLVVDPDLAVLLGLNEAHFLQQVHYWIETNRRADRNFREGFYWTFNSYPNWQKQFPFWSIDTIRRIIHTLEDINLLISGNFNQLKIDRTKWYRINYAALEELQAKTPDLYISGNGLCKLPSMQNAHMVNNAGFEGVLMDDSRMFAALKGAVLEKNG
jgi:hypothetical protein